MDEAGELLDMAAKAAPSMLSCAPGGFTMTGPHGVLALSGEKQADLNMLLIAAAPGPEDFFLAGVDCAARRGLPLLALAPRGAAERVRPVARQKGFAQAGEMPVMRLKAEAGLALQGECELTPVRGTDDVETAGRLQAEAFGLPQAAMTRLLEASLTCPTPPQIFIAARDGVAMSTVTITPHGDTAGVWTMATPQAHQRKGIGRALLTRVLRDLRGDGVRRFYLFATEAGKPLYDSLGFETVATLNAWISGTSVQTTVGGR
jgi:GNAT superfamily N-acetyltransferase